MPRQLAKWATEVSATEVSASGFPKTCVSGALYCQLLNSARPNSIDMGKVKLDTLDESQFLLNYKALAAALEKVGSPGPVDSTLLSKGNPAETLAMLTRIYGLINEASTHLMPLGEVDANAGESSGRAARGKRKAAPAAAPAKRGRAAAAAAASPAPPPPAEAPPPPPDTPTPSAAEAALRMQLERARDALAVSQAEQRNLHEEKQFYVRKLELIDDACITLSPTELPDEVQRVLRANEDELEGGR